MPDNTASTTELWEKTEQGLRIAEQMVHGVSPYGKDHDRIRSARNALVALRSRTKRIEQELEEKKQELAVAYGGGTTQPEREWFSALDRAKAERDELEERYEVINRARLAERRERKQLERKVERMEEAVEAAKVVDALAQRYVVFGAFPGQMYQLHASLASLDQEEAHA